MQTASAPFFVQVVRIFPSGDFAFHSDSMTWLAEQKTRSTW
jgi:hypothetical protein